MSIVCYDFETENLNLALCRPWQLAYLIAENGKVKKRRNLHIDIHDLKISDGAAKVTGFSWEKYNREKIPANDVIDIIEQDFINSDSILTGHNVLGYDVYIMKNLYEYAGRELDFDSFIFRTIDTLCLARGLHYMVDVPSEPVERLAFMYKMLHRRDKSFKGSLGVVAKNNGIDFDPTKLHDAMYDVELNYKVYDRLVYGTELPK
jgi:DNA polymerase III epsilon subunit-like protein